MLVQFKKCVVSHLGENVTLFRTKFADRCYIYQSFAHSESSFGDMEINTSISFLADSGEGFAAEWEPKYGPIQKWEECPEGWMGEDEFGRKIEARKHWHFPFIKNYSAMWSQLAVDREGLKPMLASGDIEGVFQVLDRWARK